MNLDAWKILMEEMEPDGVDCHSAAVKYGNGSAAEIESGIFFYSLVRRYAPKVVMETGTHWGWSSACMGLGLVDNAKDYPHLRGRLYTIDSNPYEGKPEALWERIGVSPFIIHLIGNSEQWDKSPHNIDFLFLDADHAAEAIIRELNCFGPYLNKKRALIALHDTRLDARMSPGVKEMLKHPLLTDNYRLISHVPWRNMRGLDMIYLSNEDL